MGLIWRIVSLLLVVVAQVPSHPKAEVEWGTGSVLSQGQLPWCVVYSISGYLQAGPFPMDGPTPKEMMRGVAGQDSIPDEQQAASVEGVLTYLQSLNVISYWRSTPDQHTAKEWLMSGPILVTVMLHTTMKWVGPSDIADVSGPVWTNQDGTPSGHSLLIYGYDLETDTYLVQNSWGEWYAGDGRFRIRSVDLEQIVGEWRGRYYQADKMWFLSGGGAGRPHLTL